MRAMTSKGASRAPDLFTRDVRHRQAIFGAQLHHGACRSPSTAPFSNDRNRLAATTLARSPITRRTDSYGGRSIDFLSLSFACNGPIELCTEQAIRITFNDSIAAMARSGRNADDRTVRVRAAGIPISAEIPADFPARIPEFRRQGRVTTASQAFPAGAGSPLPDIFRRSGFEQVACQSHPGIWERSGVYANRSLCGHGLLNLAEAARSKEPWATASCARLPGRPQTVGSSRSDGRMVRLTRIWNRQDGRSTSRHKG